MFEGLIAAFKNSDLRKKIFFTVMILLFSRLLTENKRLRDDNSLFI